MSFLGKKMKQGHQGPVQWWLELEEHLTQRLDMCVLHWSLPLLCRRGLLQPSPATTWWILHRSSGGWHIYMQVYQNQQQGAAYFQKYTQGFLAPITRHWKQVYSPAPRCSPASQSASLRSPLLWKSLATLFSLQSGASSWPIMTSPFE